MTQTTGKVPSWNFVVISVIGQLFQRSKLTCFSKCLSSYFRIHSLIRVCVSPIRRSPSPCNDTVSDLKTLALPCPGPRGTLLWDLSHGGRFAGSVS